MAAKTKERITIPVGGMHCASCVGKVGARFGRWQAWPFEVRWREDG